IEVTPTTAGGTSSYLPIISFPVLKLDPTTEGHHTIHEASNSVPSQTTRETIPITPESGHVPAAESGTSDKPSRERTMTAILRSFTQPSTAKPSDHTPPGRGDP